MLSIGLFAVQGRLAWETIELTSKFYEEYESISKFLMTLSPEQSLMAKIKKDIIVL